MSITQIVLGYLSAMSFVVSVIVQLIKDIIQIPTQALVIIVSLFATISSYIVGISFDYIDFKVGTAILAFFASFIVAYISMYGFDTLKQLYDRFKVGVDDGK